AFASPTQTAQKTDSVGLPAPNGWTIEHAPSSSGTMVADGGQWKLSYTLGSGAPSGQYVAAVSSVDAGQGVAGVHLVARADRPMRVSVQLRLPSGKDGERWGRSIYVDQTPRTISIPLSEFTPIGRTTTLRPVVTQVRAVLFVVDTVNTMPGTGGAIWV